MFAPDIEYNPPKGMVSLQLGDVTEVYGRLHIVARVLQMTSRQKLVVYRKGQHDEQAVVRNDYGEPHRICPYVDRSMIIERLGEHGLKEFLAGKASARRSTTTEATTHGVH